jgi:putative alpha-1,2-mannosidase
MSAWYIFTALGFYPVAPASNQYVIGRPFVDRTVMHLPNNKTFTITAQNLSDTNSYVQSINLNGQPLDRSYITHEEIMQGGELDFTMSPKDQATWSLQAQRPPYSMTKQ